MIMNKIKVTIWNEFRHEKTEDEVKALYPDGIHAFIAKNFSVDAPEFEVRLACLDDDECGLQMKSLTTQMFFCGGDICFTVMCPIIS